MVGGIPETQQDAAVGVSKDADVGLVLTVLLGCFGITSCLWLSGLRSSCPVDELCSSRTLTRLHTLLALWACPVLQEFLWQCFGQPHWMHSNLRVKSIPN